MSSDRYICELNEIINDQQAEIERLRELVGSVHPRVFKLAAKGEFVCVGEHEPYFMDVYAMIREHELSQGTWTEDDRLRYTAAQMRQTR